MMSPQRRDAAHVDVGYANLYRCWQRMLKVVEQSSMSPVLELHLPMFACFLQLLLIEEFFRDLAWFLFPVCFRLSDEKCDTILLTVVGRHGLPKCMSIFLKL